MTPSAVYPRVRLFLLALLALTLIGLRTPEASATIFEVQDFRFYYGESTIFYDDFADGVIPAIPPYAEVQGSVGMTASAGGLKMDTASAPNFLGGTSRISFTAGTTGYVQAVFRDTAPQPGHHP